MPTPRRTTYVPIVRSTRYLVVRSVVRIAFWSIPTAIGVGSLYALLILAAAWQRAVS